MMRCFVCGSEYTNNYDQEKPPIVTTLGPIRRIVGPNNKAYKLCPACIRAIVVGVYLVNLNIGNSLPFEPVGVSIEYEEES
jgi:hypothetical protein